MHRLARFFSLWCYHNLGGIASGIEVLGFLFLVSTGVFFFRLSYSPPPGGGGGRFHTKPTPLHSVSYQCVGNTCAILLYIAVFYNISPSNTI